MSGAAKLLPRFLRYTPSITSSFVLPLGKADPALRTLVLLTKPPDAEVSSNTYVAARARGVLDVDGLLTTSPPRNRKSDTTTNNALGRITGYGLGTSSNPTAYQSVSYGYQTIDGRLSTVTGGGRTFTYNYLTNSHLINNVQDTTGNVENCVDQRSYDITHDWLLSRVSTFGPNSGSPVIEGSFVNTPDGIGRATNIAKSGALFGNYGNQSDTLNTTYSYDNCSEVTGEQTTVQSTGTILPGRNNGTFQSPGYSYDNVGNRLTAIHNGNSTPYYTDVLNQYTARTVPGIFDVACFDANNGVQVSTSGGATSSATRNGNLYCFDGYHFSVLLPQPVDPITAAKFNAIWPPRY